MVLGICFVLLGKKTYAAEASSNIITTDTIYSLKYLKAGIGTTVKTKGAFVVNDNGGANYVITDKPKSPADDIFTIKLQSGLYAELQTNGVVNVAQAKIYPGKNISKELNTLIEAADSTGLCNTIVFNDGYYYIDKPIKLRSLTYKGSSNTNLSVAKGFETGDDKVLYTYPDNNHSIYSLNISNINFLFDISNYQSAKNKEIYLMALQEIDGCNIENCKFRAYSSDVNAAFVKTNLLWFKHSSVTNNVKINNCMFLNLTGEVYKGAMTDYIVGGCLWVCGPDETNNVPITNFSVTSCNFTSTTNDEVIGMWRGDFSNIYIGKCTFNTQSHDNDNVVSFYNASFKNTIMSSCIFNLNSPARYSIKIAEIPKESEFKFSGLHFNLNSNVNNDTRNIALFMSEQTMAGIPKNVPVTMDIYNVTVRSKEDTKAMTLVAILEAENRNIKIRNSDIDAPFSHGVYYLNNVKNSSLTVENSKINTYNALSTNDRLYNCNIIVKGNTIANKLSNLVRNAIAINYNFSNNTCTGTTYSALFNCMNLTKEDYINLVDANNIYTTDATHYYFYTNGNLNQSDIIKKE